MGTTTIRAYGCLLKNIIDLYYGYLPSSCPCWFLDILGNLSVFKFTVVLA